MTAKVGITLEEAKKILAKARKEKLPIVDDDFNLKGLITIKDIEKQIKYPLSAKDCSGPSALRSCCRHYCKRAGACRSAGKCTCGRCRLRFRSWTFYERHQLCKDDQGEISGSSR